MKSSNKLETTIKWKNTKKEPLVLHFIDHGDYEDYMYHAVHCGEIEMEEILSVTFN